MQTTQPSRRSYYINRAEPYRSNLPINIDCKQIKRDILANVYNCAEAQKKEHEGIEGGLFVGIYGNVYTLFHLSQKSMFKDEKEKLLSYAANLMKKGLATAAYFRSTDTSEECGFLLGKAGLYALGAVIFFEVKRDDIALECINQFTNVGMFCARPDYAYFGGDELFVGRAGFLCASLWLNKYFNRPVIPDNITDRICCLIIESGRNYAREQSIGLPLMFHYFNDEYLGAAHGLASILLMVLCCKSYVDNDESVDKDIKTCVDFLVSNQTNDGNFPNIYNPTYNIKETESKIVHWCHGAPGIFFLLVKAYLRWHTPNYLYSAIRVGELVWKKGLVKTGPGLCHGIAGNAYIFLILYKITGREPTYLYRANEFAKFLKSEQFKLSWALDNPYSLFEGYAGTICFLADLMEPDTAVYPFLDIL